MTQGAYSVHKEIKQELIDYIGTQYFGKTPILFSALKEKLSEEGVLYREPYIESLPAYTQVQDGFWKANIDDWMKAFFDDLTKSHLRVYNSPFSHQLKALESWSNGEDVFVSTGTGSGKTECFMWPILAKLVREAKEDNSWNQHGVRVMIMYPMNALVSDQLARLRKLIGDPDGEFVDIFRKHANSYVRRPQFGMYTSRTPYPGTRNTKKDKRLANTYKQMLRPPKKNESAYQYYISLLKNGRVPAKDDLEHFIEMLKEGVHETSTNDAELLTRFEIQEACPDILITNYSMLEYMLMRETESRIWNSTKEWLQIDPKNKLLFVIDEAHMYRGSSGGEVALLIRRLLHKLEVGNDRIQFILTTASMPHDTVDERKTVKKFAFNLTGKKDFNMLYGDSDHIDHSKGRTLLFVEPYPDLIEQIESERTRLEGLNYFWGEATNGELSFSSLESAERWMYDHLCDYTPFGKLIDACRGNAVSISDLAHTIYPDLRQEKGEAAVSLLISVAQIARSEKDIILFPAKMHLLFRGLKGVFACCNPNCSHSHVDNGIRLGEVIINDDSFVCPECGSAVYELYQDRRCGALYYKGYIVEDERNRGFAYLWHYPGQVIDCQMYELHLYIPPEGFTNEGMSFTINPCYLNISSGFIDFKDDRHSGDPNYRKLYYSDYTSKDWPDVWTFSTCPHCRKIMSRLRLSSFATRGNQSFDNLIKAQFNSQDPVADRTKEPQKFPNEGRKVLLFSDSRRTAATLARDMTDEAEAAAARQLFMCAIKSMMEEKGRELSLDNVYGYILDAAIHHNVFSIFDDKFREDRDKIAHEQNQNSRMPEMLRKPVDLAKYTISVNSMPDVQEQLLRLFCGNYNTLSQNALVRVVPMDDELRKILFAVGSALDIDFNDAAELANLHKKVLEVFSAWFYDVCDSNQALGHTIPNYVRNRVRRNYKERFGLAENWEFRKVIRDDNGWSKDDDELKAFHRAFSDFLLERSTADNDLYFIKLDAVKPLYEPNHTWYRCLQCSEVTPYLLNGRCPSCGSENINSMGETDYEALSFWRTPAIEAAEDNAPIRVIDTEEHTAQLSHKDQQNDMWSKTEKYEMRFQDMISNGETPVDILSSTTTMEVGIDIGSLVAVGLRNIPPMRENYQQRAGRAGRRGSALSTIITFCENGPFDTLYFEKPVPMFRGNPREPWIDTDNRKLLCRHLNMLTIQDFLKGSGLGSMDKVHAETLLYEYLDDFSEFLSKHKFDDVEMLLGEDLDLAETYKEDLYDGLLALKDKCMKHPELYENDNGEPQKALLDALYEEGIVPTYSFPKNVVSFTVSKYDYNQKRTVVEYKVERGLDMAISEYAPGRTAVIDKKTYQIGGLYAPYTEIADPESPALKFVDDPNYRKSIIGCEQCEWFGINDHPIDTCPFCGSKNLKKKAPMIRPWGFAPRNAKEYSVAQVDDVFSNMREPLYSTLSSAEEMKSIPGYINVCLSPRADQSIIMVNNGPSGHGFSLCPDCGAIAPFDRDNPLKYVSRPYVAKETKACSHSRQFTTNLGFELRTDMLVLEFRLDKKLIDTSPVWGVKAAISLSEGLHLAACDMIDVEFSELVAGARRRNVSDNQYAYIDIYIYDSLSSGAGYSEFLAEHIEELLGNTEKLLDECSCDSACQHCLKHYRNQRVHGKLSRHAALDLLRWAKNGNLPRDYSIDEQCEIIRPLESILSDSGVKLTKRENEIIASNGKIEKKLIIYPAMQREKHRYDEIHISDYLLKYAKPTGVERILTHFK